MKNLECTFYRPEDKSNLKEFDAICAKLREDLAVIISGEAELEDVKTYTANLIKLGVDYDDRGVLLWHLDIPGNLCPEGFIFYVAEPTRYAMAILVNVRLKYPEAARSVQGFELALYKALRGCAICGFMGHGYDADRYLVKTIRELKEWNVETYLIMNMKCDFQAQYRKAKMQVQRIAKHPRGGFFSDEQLVKDAKEVAGDNRDKRKNSGETYIIEL